MKPGRKFVEGSLKLLQPTPARGSSGFGPAPILRAQHEPVRGMGSVELEVRTSMKQQTCLRAVR
jgi:hypothetical protein